MGKNKGKLKNYVLSLHLILSVTKLPQGPACNFGSTVVKKQTFDA